ncbi:MAG: SCO family protein [Chloroflexi bacterium]|nr:MAG: SCO family protein [Chloroflexota bacterium]
MSSAKSAKQSKLQYVFMGLIVVSAFVAAFSISRVLTARDDAPLADTINPVEGEGLAGYARVDPPHELRDFELTSQTGEAIHLSDLRGKTTLMFFGYTNCPDVCPTTLADYTTVKEQLGDVAEEVNFVFISVDGTRDTPETVAEYLARYDEDFIGMTGSEDLLRQIGQEYGLQFTIDDTVSVGHTHEDGEGHDFSDGDEQYFIEHTSPSFLIDKNGLLRALYFYGTRPDVIAESIVEFMAET